MKTVVLPLLLAVVAAVEAGCSTVNHEDSRFFRRYTPSDPAAFQLEIAQVRSELALLRAQGKQREALRTAADLGGMLTSARKERDAKALLERTSAEARTIRADDAQGWALLNLATANQYLGLPSEASPQFDEALRLAIESGDRELQHYVYHHRGRLKAELGDVDEARSDFEHALAIRRELGDRVREQSTLGALEELSSDIPRQRP